MTIRISVRSLSGAGGSDGAVGGRERRSSSVASVALDQGGGGGGQAQSDARRPGGPRPPQGALAVHAELRRATAGRGLYALIGVKQSWLEL